MHAPALGLGEAPEYINSSSEWHTAESWFANLQRRVRDARAGYVQSLEVLQAARECGVYTKSSIMLGLGEADDEIVDTMLDLRHAGECRWFWEAPHAGWGLAWQGPQRLAWMYSMASAGMHEGRRTLPASVESAL